MTDKEILIYIERYVKGELLEIEIDQLWIEFLKDPYWYDYFNTYLQLVAISRTNSALRERIK